MALGRNTNDDAPPGERASTVRPPRVRGGTALEEALQQLVAALLTTSLRASPEHDARRAALDHLSRSLANAAMTADVGIADLSRLVNEARRANVASAEEGGRRLERLFDEALAVALDQTLVVRTSLADALGRLSAAATEGKEALCDRLGELVVEKCRAIGFAAVFLADGGQLRLRGGAGVDLAAATLSPIPLDSGPLAATLADGRARAVDAAGLGLELWRSDERSWTAFLHPLGASSDRFGVACFVAPAGLEVDDDEQFVMRSLCVRLGVLLARTPPGATGATAEALGPASEAILRAVGLGVMGLDRDERVCFVNDAALRLLGIPAEQILGRDERTVIHTTRPDGSEYQGDDCPLQLTLHDGRLRETTGELLHRPDGGTFPVNYVANAIREHGEVTGLVVVFSDESERQRVLEATRRSEHRFRSLVTALSQIVWVTDPDGQANEDSPTWRDYTGQSFADARGHGWLAAVHPDDRERLLTAFRAAVAGQTVFELDYRIRRHDGVYRWFLARGAPVLEPDGSLREWVGACIDIDDRQRHQTERDLLVDELTRERRKLAAILERIPVGVVIGEPPLGRVTVMNREFFQVTGDSPKLESLADYQRLLARRPDGSVLPVDEWPLVRALLFGGETKEQPLDLVRANGQKVSVSVSALPLFDDEGRIEAAVATLVDVTQLRESEARSRLLDRLTRLLATSLDGRDRLDRALREFVPEFSDAAAVHVLGERGELAETFVFASDPALESVVRALGRSLGPESAPPTPLAKMLRSGTPLVVARVAPGTLTALTPSRPPPPTPPDLRSLAVLPLTARGKLLGVLALATTRDRELTHAKFAFAQELARRLAVALDNARLYSAAQEAVRARDQLLSMASHDLKSPLTSLRMQTQMIQRHLKAGTDPQALLTSTFERMSMMDRQLVRLAGMLDELLDVSRLHAGRLDLHPEPVDLSALVRETAERLQGAFAKEDARLALNIESGLVGMWDRLRLEQVLMNLLTNAAKYGSGHPVEVRLWRDGRFARLAVCDHGIGITPDDMNRIFEPFERATSRHRKVPGTGLGLWIAKRIVDAMDGRITVESTEGQGSTFHVCLPIGERNERVGN